MNKYILLVAVLGAIFLSGTVTAQAFAVDTQCTIHIDKDGCALQQKTSRGDIKNTVTIYAGGGGTGTTYDDSKVKADIAALQSKDTDQDSANQQVASQLGNVATGLGNTVGQINTLQTDVSNNGISDNATVARVAELEKNIDNLTSAVQKLAQEINDTTIVVQPVNQTGNQTGNNTGGGGGTPTCKPDETLVDNECIPNVPPVDNQTGNQTGGGTGNGTGGGTGNQTGNQTGGGTGNGTSTGNETGNVEPTSFLDQSASSIVSVSDNDRWNNHNMAIPTYYNKFLN